MIKYAWPFPEHQALKSYNLKLLNYFIKIINIKWKYKEKQVLLLSKFGLFHFSPQPNRNWSFKTFATLNHQVYITFTTYGGFPVFWSGQRTATDYISKVAIPLSFSHWRPQYPLSANSTKWSNTLKQFIG